MKTFETIQDIACPKGENRQPAENWMRQNGFVVPTVRKRCLHQRSV